MVFVFSASITKPSEVLYGKMWLIPTSLYFDGYVAIFKYKDIWTGYLNSVIIVVLGTLLSLAVTFMAGYALSRKDFYAKKFLMWIFTFTMFFGGGLIPTYLLISESLNMYDSVVSLIIPSAVSVWNIILIRTYFISSLPQDLLEAAKIDGCDNIRFFIMVAIPLAVPIIAVITLYNVVGRWNSYFDALIFLSDPAKYPLQLVIRNLLTQNQINSLDPNVGILELESMMKVEGMKYGVIIVSTLPMLVIYPFVQKYFIKGIMVGSLKG
ncbi:MAG: carbohydrate ABC transporter permease [Clostridiales bacterium]|nr:carbohydrate ABC transporter permease [Clostridiales bacterium]